MTQINTTISLLNLTEDMGERIRDFVVENQDGLDSMNELGRFMSVLSPSLKLEILNHEFYECVWL
jgi:hypothetical protein